MYAVSWRSKDFALARRALALGHENGFGWVFEPAIDGRHLHFAGLNAYR